MVQQVVARRHQVSGLVAEVSGNFPITRQRRQAGGQETQPRQPCSAFPANNETATHVRRTHSWAQMFHDHAFMSIA